MYQNLKPSQPIGIRTHCSLGLLLEEAVFYNSVGGRVRGGLCVCVCVCSCVEVRGGTIHY